MSDPAEDVAAAVVAFVTDPTRGYSRGVAASVPAIPANALNAEQKEFRLVLIPVGETEEKQARGRVSLAPVVNVVAMADALTFGTRQEFNAHVREIRQSLRFVSMAGWTWQRSETLTKYDPDSLGKTTYLSAFALTYLGIE